MDVHDGKRIVQVESCLYLHQNIQWTFNIYLTSNLNIENKMDE